MYFFQAVPIYLFDDVLCACCTCSVNCSRAINSLSVLMVHNSVSQLDGTVDILRMDSSAITRIIVIIVIIVLLVLLLLLLIIIIIIDTYLRLFSYNINTKRLQ